MSEWVGGWVGGWMGEMRDERKEEERSKQGQTKQQGKVTHHTQDSHFSYKNELPQVGLEPTTL